MGPETQLRETYKPIMHEAAGSILRLQICQERKGGGERKREREKLLEQSTREQNHPQSYRTNSATINIMPFLCLGIDLV